MQKHTVLVVEDDENMALMLRDVLSDRFDIHVCTSKALAIVQAKEYLEANGQPDVVIIDLIINGEGGLDLYHWMHEHGYTPPVVFLTGCHQRSPEFLAAKGTGELVYEKENFSSVRLAEIIESLVATPQAQTIDSALRVP